MNKLLSLSVLLFAATLPAQVTVLKNVDLIDGSGAAPKRGVSILISGGRIRDIRPADQLKAPSGANVVDLSGKTVMPGIINLHGHVGLVKGLTQARENYTRDNIEAQLRAYASYGVTSLVSMGSDIEPELIDRK